MFYDNTIDLVMYNLTERYNISNNRILFYELCERIWFVKDEWMPPRKIETIAKLIANNTLNKVGDIILYNDGIEEIFGIYICHDGSVGGSVPYDELYLMGLLGD